MKALRVLAHAALLTAPAAAFGRFAEVMRPQALACVTLLLLLGEIEAAAQDGPEACASRAPGVGLARVSALALLGTAWAAIGWPSLAPAPSWSWLGVPLIAGGIALRATAIRTLGRSFTSEIVATPERPLVTHGIYAHLRHPSEVGLLLVALGLCALGSSLRALVITALAMTPSVVLRVIAEERALATGHRVAHARYRAAVGLIATRGAASRTPRGREN